MKQLKAIFNKINQFGDKCNISLLGAAMFLQGASFTALGTMNLLSHQDDTTSVPAKMTLGIGLITLALVSAGYVYTLYYKNKKTQANTLKL